MVDCVKSGTKIEKYQDGHTIFINEWHLELGTVKGPLYRLPWFLEAVDIHVLCLIVATTCSMVDDGK